MSVYLIFPAPFDSWWPWGLRDTMFLLERSGKLWIPLSPTETQAAKCVCGTDGRWTLAVQWLFQCLAGFQWYRGILPDAESKRRWGNLIFFCKALVFAGNSKGCFYFAVRGKHSSFPSFIKWGSSDHFQGLYQLLALAILNAFSSRGGTIFQYQRHSLPRLREPRYTTHPPCTVWCKGKIHRTFVLINCVQLSPDAFAIPTEIGQLLLDYHGCSSALEIALASPCLDGNPRPKVWAAGEWRSLRTRRV